MPEGPEVRHYADALATALENKTVLEITARTKNAKLWLLKNAEKLKGRSITRVFSRGKNIIGLIEGGFYFYSHQMMWGSWIIIQDKPFLPPDRRERARIVVEDAAAILNSAPIFEVGKGNPLTVPSLVNLGPDVLPYEGETFDAKETLQRLCKKEHKNTPIGAALLDQTIVAGLGNYLRAEILFLATIDPWRAVKSLSKKELQTIVELIPQVSKTAYAEHRTVTADLQTRMIGDPSLVYVPGKEYGTRHYVFRRTNLPCLMCGTPIKQKRQVLGSPDEETQEEETEKTSRIVYFCPQCQHVGEVA